MDVLYNVTFTFIRKRQSVYQVTGIDGVFPEVGALLINDHSWQDRLFNFTALKYNRQYCWVQCLLAADGTSAADPVKEAIDSILTVLQRAISRTIVPYLATIHPDLQIKQFWRDPQVKMHNHWMLLLKTIRQPGRSTH